MGVDCLVSGLDWSLVARTQERPSRRERPEKKEHVCREIYTHSAALTQPWTVPLRPFSLGGMFSYFKQSCRWTEEQFCCGCAVVWTPNRQHSEHSRFRNCCLGRSDCRLTA
ncbi:hypothetical protein DdX_11734 [Ditylenchus destructor]|uniref:Uncharacterized protein n=1 Tax=Ditylenchus destructor TaxID=166010 RepID=A0AAD4R438_9BILA|nr:hypothetical protein DdX_11734 [Ditylenchus destructor]